MAADRNNRIADLALVREQTQRIRDLRGFLKSHSVPTDYTSRTAQFVTRIAEQDVSHDLDHYFNRLRRAFGYSRRELIVSEPGGGTAAIETPDFEYRITASQSAKVPTEVVLRRQVSQFANIQVAHTEKFSKSFANLFNAVELTLVEPIFVEDVIDWVEEQSADATLIEYDRTALWCEISLRDVPGGSLNVQAERLCVMTAAAGVPAKLLQLLDEFRAQLPGIDRLLTERA